MDWISKLENRFGRFAIPNLIRAIAVLNGAVFFLYLLDPSSLNFLVLDPRKVLAGEVWRLFTYILIPQFGGMMPTLIGVAFYILFLVWLGNGLEQAMGSFRLNLYFFTGMLGCTVAAFAFGGTFAGALLNGSLLFAFARHYPDEMIYILYVLPVKVKWMAWAMAAYMMLNFLSHDNSYRITLIATLANYLLFFGRDIIEAARHRHQVHERRARYESAKVPETESLHVCTVCRRTEMTNPDLEFRVSKDGNEYCVEHIPKAVS